MQTISWTLDREKRRATEVDQLQKEADAARADSRLKKKKTRPAGTGPGAAVGVVQPGRFSVMILFPECILHIYHVSLIFS